ncbi:WAP four-disulfide core domain protein 1-like isoform X2 [Centruroides vittatus]|uniref:WAP four-disulfide core domain protein 1-like isoform X2 n=1 Tax=Centruroides vittatus TaxID=120091 RepID=UPI0035105ADD
MKALLICFLVLYLQLYGCTCEEKPNNFRPESLEQLQHFLTKLMSSNDTDQQKCPAPTWPIEKEKCSARRCRFHADCDTLLCCYNGCVFTCTQQMAPAAVIDWLQEADMNSVALPDVVERSCSGSSISAPTETTGCPSGYTCRIKEPGDPVRGIPSSGTCIPNTLQEGKFSVDESDLFKEKVGKDTVYLPGGCLLTAQQYEHMQQFMLKSYVVDCFCIKGSVECQVML